jgi:hypothetical protein
MPFRQENGTAVSFEAARLAACSYSTGLTTSIATTPDMIKNHTAKPVYQKRASIMSPSSSAASEYRDVSANHVQTMFGCRRKQFKIEADKNGWQH